MPDFFANFLNERVLDTVKRGGVAVRHLLRNSSDSNTANTTGKKDEAALLCAVKEGDVEAVKMLLSAGVNPNAAEAEGDTVLTLATKSGNAEVVKALLDGKADPQHNGDDSSIALFWAVRNKNESISKMLLDAGANANSSYYGDWATGCGKGDHVRVWTALKEAVTSGNVGLVRILLDHEADADISEYYEGHVSPLYLAVMTKSAEIAEVLLEEADADPNIGADCRIWGSWEYGTPLVRAVRNDDFEMARILLNFGANPHADEDSDPNLWSWVSDLDDSDRRRWEKLLLSPEKWEKKMTEELCLAAEQGRIDGVREALAEGVDFTPDRDGYTGMDAALHKAASAGHAEIVKVLLFAGANPNAANRNGWTALMGVGLKHPEVIKILLVAGANPNLADSDGLTILMRAALEGDSNVVRILLTADVDMEEEDGYYGGTALILAATKGRVEATKMLLSAGANLSAVNRDGWTALMHAAYEGHCEVAKALLLAGANPNALDKFGNTALDYAKGKDHPQYPRISLDWNHPEVVRVLEEAKAGLDKTDENGATNMIRAVKRGDAAATERLLSTGANPNAVDKDGCTALMYAARQGDAKSAGVLLSAGANSGMARKNNGATALIVAAERGHVAFVKMLTATGANPNAALNDGTTALIAAAQHGHVEFVKVLVAAGANPNAADKDGRTALAHAVRREHEDVVQALLSAGADANVADKSERTVLMSATRQGHSNIVRFLLSAGANPNAANVIGMTALDYAKKSQFSGLVNLLLNKGADPFAGKDDVGFVYLATNESMPGLVKIGMTKGDVDERIKELSGATGVPTAFKCVFAVKVVSPKKMEESLHNKYDFCRVRERREFFKIDWRAVKLYLEEITK